MGVLAAGEGGRRNGSSCRQGRKSLQQGADLERGRVRPGPSVVSGTGGRCSSPFPLEVQAGDRQSQLRLPAKKNTARVATGATPAPIRAHGLAGLPAMWYRPYMRKQKVRKGGWTKIFLA